MTGSGVSSVDVVPAGVKLRGNSRGGRRPSTIQLIVCEKRELGFTQTCTALRG